MSSHSKCILLVTNGAVAGFPALEYGVWLAGVLDKPVRLLGISGQQHERRALVEALEVTRARLEGLEIPNEILIEEGDVREVICRLADPKQHLVVIGPLGNPRWRRWLRGRKYRQILEDIDAPLIYVPFAQNKIEHILVCMGGLGYAHSVEQWALYLARQTHADITILHVLEKIYYEYPTATQIQTHGEEILNTDTPHARNLRLAIQKTLTAGIPADLKIRQGDIIHEILSEINAGDYDLVAMGTQSSAHSLRRLFTPNVTAKVAEAINIPVLTAQSGQELIFE